MLSFVSFVFNNTIKHKGLKVLHKGTQRIFKEYPVSQILKSDLENADDLLFNTGRTKSAGRSFVAGNSGNRNRLAYKQLILCEKGIIYLLSHIRKVTA